MEHINRRIYLVVLTLWISSFGYKLIQEPLQKRTKLLLDSETQEDLEIEFCDATFIHLTPEEFGKGGFNLKTHGVYSVQTTREAFKKATIAVVLDLCLRKSQAGECRDYRNPLVFEKLCFQNWSVHTKTKGRRFHISLV